MRGNRVPWMASLHGGHSEAYCDHASSRIEDMLEQAVEIGMNVFGLTEHVPRDEERFLYPNELALGWDIAKIQADFEAYAQDSLRLAEIYADRLAIPRGMEIEVASDDYAERMQYHRERHAFDYIVGSAHHLDGLSIDADQETFAVLIERYGGLEPLSIRYYEVLAAMIDSLKPEVVGHPDLVRKNAGPWGETDTPAIRRAAGHVLEAARAHGCILDVNTAGYRKGLGGPYMAPWLVTTALEMGIGMCFGDDSHSVDDVGAGIPEARDYLMALGVKHITTLIPKPGGGVSKLDIGLA